MYEPKEVVNSQAQLNELLKFKTGLVLILKYNYHKAKA